jgi:hypothetical protein
MDGLEVVRNLRRNGYDDLVFAVAGEDGSASCDGPKYPETLKERPVPRGTGRIREVRSV